MPVSTVGLECRRLGLGRLKNLDPPTPAIRYERNRPGELLHLDIKKLARIEAVGHRIHGDRRRMSRGAGWEFLHVCIDDATRLAVAAKVIVNHGRVVHRVASASSSPATASTARQTSWSGGAFRPSLR